MGRKSRSRSREKKHHKHHKSSKRDSHKRSRSRSPRVPQRSRSRSPRVSKYSKKQTSPPMPKSKTLDSLTLGGGLTLGNVKPKSLLPMQATQFVDPQLLEGKTNEEIEMMTFLGFISFDSTKGKHVDGSCNAGAPNIQEKRRYRQYMNRKGGFNMTLDTIA